MWHAVYAGYRGKQVVGEMFAIVVQPVFPKRTHGSQDLFSDTQLLYCLANRSRRHVLCHPCWLSLRWRTPRPLSIKQTRLIPDVMICAGRVACFVPFPEFSPCVQRRRPAVDDNTGSEPVLASVRYRRAISGLPS